jgi:glycosyltransferase involved in cell wall biosynthesis
MSHVRDRSISHESTVTLPLVSILIPAFNKEEWIAQTLRSAVAQTWLRKEIIVVDDGSTDRTLEIATRFQAAGVRVVTQQNTGAAAARNHALALSSGDYVQWLDADDLLAPDKIARQVLTAASRGPRTLVSCEWTRFMYRHHRARFLPDALWCDLSPADFLLRKLDQNLFMPNAAWLVSRELTNAAGGWDPTQHVDDDGEYFCRVLLQSEGVQFVAGARMYYRVAPDNTLSDVGRSPSKLEAQWRSVQLHIGHLQSLENSERTRRACVRFLQVSLNYFFPERPEIVEQAKQLARQFGGELTVPRLSWKYAWIAKLFGWGAARRFQRALPRLKWSVVKHWDRVLFRASPESQRLLS